MVREGLHSASGEYNIFLQIIPSMKALQLLAFKKQKVHKIIVLRDFGDAIGVRQGLNPKRTVLDMGSNPIISTIWAGVHSGDCNGL